MTIRTDHKCPCCGEITDHRYDGQQAMPKRGAQTDTHIEVVTSSIPQWTCQTCRSSWYDTRKAVHVSTEWREKVSR